MVLRKLRFGGPSFEEIGLPDSVRTLAGSTGAGPRHRPHGVSKTTTSPRSGTSSVEAVHIVTIEDPIEAASRRRGSINQRGRQRHPGLLSALRSALRQDPDVILIGEMGHGDGAQALQAADRSPRDVDAAHDRCHRR
jgi:twitching motility protein PilT